MKAYFQWGHLPKKQFIVLLLLIFSTQSNFGQKQVIKPQHTQAIDKKVLNAPVADTSKVNKAMAEKQVTANAQLITAYNLHPEADTVWDLKPFLASKQNCDFEKAIDTNGCILVKYNDGLIKKICNGSVVEVITPDGKKHVARIAGSTFYHYVVRIPSPQNPSATDISYKWLVAYNENLLTEISVLLGDNQNLVTQFKNREKIKCEHNIYKEIEYRTLFIEEVLKAK
jgi:hypothetical protein